MKRALEIGDTTNFHLNRKVIQHRHCEELTGLPCGLEFRGNLSNLKGSHNQ